jgi:hypothetical protein
VASAFDPILPPLEPVRRRPAWMRAQISLFGDSFDRDLVKVADTHIEGGSARVLPDPPVTLSREIGRVDTAFDQAER